jgi:squalene synthase HpnC
MDTSIPGDLRSAYSQCEKLALTHYENFPVASLLLPKKSRPHVAALYAFARTADDFADEEAFEGKRLPQLNLWEKQLKAAMKGKKAPWILRACAHTLKSFQIPLFLPLDLLKAYRMDLTVKRYATWKDLLYYCRHSANPVGRMVLYISGFRGKKLHEYSDYICTGLQLTNFWQDSAIDLKRNRIYYPRQELKKAGVAEKDLLALRDSARVRRLVKNAVEYTENYYERGLPLLEEVSGRLRLELKATYLGGQGILNKIKSIDYNVIQHRPAWSAKDKIVLVLKALFTRVRPFNT